MTEQKIFEGVKSNECVCKPTQSIHVYVAKYFAPRALPEPPVVRATTRRRHEPPVVRATPRHHIP